MGNIYTVFILFLLFGDFTLDTVIDTLNLKRLSFELPEQYKTEFKDLYEPSKYRTYLNYQRANINFNLFKRPIDLGVLIIFIFSGGFNTIDKIVRSFGFGEILSGIFFIGILSLLKLLLDVPFSLYDTFVIEERYGFNKTTIKTFILDIFKGIILSAILGTPILALLLYFFKTTQNYAWIYSWLALTTIQLVILFLAPAFILPLFNKFDPLPDGDLKKAIEHYSSTQNFKLSGIFQMDGSKRTTKSNAFFTGFGKFRRLVLFDTLIQKHSTDELVAVLAHEIGHFKKHHILKSMLLSIISTGLLFYFFSSFLNNQLLFATFKMESISIYASLVFISFLYSPISRLLSIFSNWLSRKFEFEADRYARETYGKPESLISALKKLSIDNLSHLTPHPLKVFLEYTHPTMIERIQALRNNQNPTNEKNIRE